MQKIFLFLMGLAAVSAQADVLDRGDYTEDTATGLLWLDVTKTRGMSYDEVVEATNTFGEFAGCRHATLAEFETLIGNFGIPPQGNSCIGEKTYCGDLPAQYLEQHEVLIRMLGDVEDAYWDETNNTFDVPPDGAGFMRGYLDSPDTFDPDNRVATGYLYDGERVSRADETNTSDGTDVITGSGLEFDKSYTDPQIGSLLVCDAWPPQYPEGVTNIDFEAISGGAPAPVATQGYRFTGWGSYGDGQFGQASVTDNGGDKHFRAEGYGDSVFINMFASLSVEREDGGPFALYEIDIVEGTTEVLGTTADGRMISSNDQPNFGSGDWLSMRDVYLDATQTCILFTCSIQLGVDDVGVAEAFNAEIDFDTTSIANEIRPNDAYAVTVAVLTTEIADGDPYDFDATQIDLATVGFGPDGAPSSAPPQSIDADSDGDTDVVLTFEMADTGITCLQDTVKLTGGTLGGGVFAGRADVTRVGCAQSVEIDFDPWSTANEIRPDSLDMVGVGVKTTNIASGDSLDFDATQVNPLSLAFGPAGGSVRAVPLTSDLDSDGDTDMIFGFKVEESGVLCEDTDITITGETYSGQQFTGTDTITTTDCTVASCHP